MTCGSYWNNACSGINGLGYGNYYGAYAGLGLGLYGGLGYPGVYGGLGCYGGYPGLLGGCGAYGGYPFLGGACGLGLGACGGYPFLGGYGLGLGLGGLCGCGIAGCVGGCGFGPLSNLSVDYPYYACSLPCFNTCYPFWGAGSCALQYSNCYFPYVGTNCAQPWYNNYCGQTFNVPSKRCKTVCK